MLRVCSGVGSKIDWQRSVVGVAFLRLKAFFIVFL